MADKRESRFVGDGSDVNAPQCWYCTRAKAGQKCDAFPLGIPVEIKQNRHDHRLPYPGDGGILFEPMQAYEGQNLVFKPIGME